MIRDIRQAFWRHELWVLRKAQTFPLGAMFMILTLSVWGIPMLPLLFLFNMVEFLEAGQSMLKIAMLVVQFVAGLALLTLIAPWFFRWYFIGAGLMFGRRGMAQRKEAETLIRLGMITQ